MRKGLVHALAWTLATGAAVTLSWWGVHSVMSGTAYDPPLAVPLATRPQPSPPPPAPAPAPSAQPFSPVPSPSRSALSAPASGPAPARPAPRPSPSTPRPEQRTTAAAPGDVTSYTVSGGRVVLQLGVSSAELVSATPAAGWRMQVWKQDFWIRVTFTRDDQAVSVFCTWYGYPPRVEIAGS
ncbi:hypothetical protein [Streptomyces sp. NPDC051567]|uniref:hypothetical protein n=1 Tax=Streptomyces sp. NPDC051567 TaxID=3365660 RepID=UPI003795AB3C